MLNKKEKEVLKSIVRYHLKEVNKDKKFSKDLVSLLGAEAKYEKVLKDILKKL